MTEDDAKNWIVVNFGQLALDELAVFVELVRAESALQNLISASTMSAIWVRHVMDSAQLVSFPKASGLWIDIGTGAGFPGMVTAILTRRPTLLVEPRARRAAFLQNAIDRMGLSPTVSVRQSRIETITETADIVSARAVASIESLFSAAAKCADRDTVWLLPKGRAAHEEVARAKKTWHGTFHVEQSITDPDSMIVIANGVARR